jgi:hypothetical protein
VATHPVARASKTTEAVNLSNPHPPYSGEWYIPPNPRVAASFITSIGKCEFLSHSSAKGRILFSVKSKAVY